MDSGTKATTQALDWAKQGFERLQSSSPQDAAEAFRRAIEAAPSVDLYHFGLGEARRRAERPAEAEAAFRRSLEINPDFAEARVALGFLQLSRGVPRAALAELERAVVAMPAMARAWLGVAIARLGVGAAKEAEDAARRALAAKPDDVETLALLAIALAVQGKTCDAEVVFAAALDQGRATYGRVEELASSLHNMGRPREALIAYRRLARDAGWAKRSIHKLFEVTLDRPDPDMAAAQAERRRWGLSMTKGLVIPAHDNAPDPERRLRLGFVGGIFCANSSRHVLLPLLRVHDRKRYDIVLYSGTKREDDVTAEYRRLADDWRVVRALDQRAAARMIRDDRIDILIDLNGISEDHRLDIFAAKPAPVQISAWGYPAGTGLPTMDALFTDAAVVKEDERRHFAESVHYLPCWACFDPEDVPRLEPRPSTPNPVFGSLTRIRKLAEESYDVWSALLVRVPGSRLLLKDFALDDPLIVRRVQDAFMDRGIGPTRLELIGSSNRTEHLRTLGRIDVALSPLPHSGGVTTFEALALGVPVVTLDGATVAERNSAAILKSVNRGAWVAQTPEDYVAVAADLIADRERLKGLRRDLPGEIRKFPACNPALYMASVDRAYRGLWRDWCARQRQLSMPM